MGVVGAGDLAVLVALGVTMVAKAPTEVETEARAVQVGQAAEEAGQEAVVVAGEPEARAEGEGASVRRQVLLAAAVAMEAWTAEAAPREAEAAMVVGQVVRAAQVARAGARVEDTVREALEVRVEAGRAVARRLALMVD